MRASASKRSVIAVIAFLAFVGYLGMRDTVRVEGDLPRKDVKAIVHGVKEWSVPKLFRHITVERGPGGTVLGSVREPGGRLSVTVFTNHAGGWKRCGWYLLETDKNMVRH